MKQVRILSCILVVCLIVLSGCGSGGGSKTTENSSPGGVTFDIDLSGLEEYTSTASRKSGKGAAEITTVSVHLNNPNHDSVDEELTINDNVASGTVENLAVGYWSVNVNVMGASGLLFVGNTDVEVKKGVTTGCTVLFDPADSLVEEGAVAITVGINPVPGFKRMPELVINDILVTNENVIMFEDYSIEAGGYKMAVYDMNLNRLMDHILMDKPVSACLSYDKSAVIVGSEIDDVLRSISSVDIVSGTITTISDVFHLKALSAVTEDLLMMVGQMPMNEVELNIKGDSIDTAILLHAGDPVVAYSQESEYFYHMFTEDIPETGAMQIERIGIDEGGFGFTVPVLSNYTETYELAQPLKTIKKGKRLLTAAGDLFIASADEALDMTFVKNIGITFQDLVTNDNITPVPPMPPVGDDIVDYIFLINKNADKQLVVIDDIHYAIVSAVDLPEKPVSIGINFENIYVFVEYEGEVFGKLWFKSDLVPATP